MTTGIGSGDSPQRRTKVRFAHISRKAVLGMAALGLAGGAALAAPEAAMASGNPVTGTVTVGQTVTLSLSASTFTLNAPPGTNNALATPITATANSNDPNGYMIAEDLAQQATGPVRE